jgi:hypothetical protein
MSDTAAHQTANSGRRDWVAWHESYADEESDLSVRLRVVQTEIRGALDRSPAGPFRAVSLCAGQGHDLIGALAHYPDSDRVSARLVEVNPFNVRAMRERATQQGLDLDIVEGDAADTSLYRGAVPADLVLAVGIFGNVADEDVFRLIGALPQFCVHGATVIWSRGRSVPNLNEQIQSAFTAAGFVQAAFHAPDDGDFQIGVNLYEGPARELEPARLFTFRR